MMNDLSAALAVNQAMTQNQLGMEIFEMANKNQQQLAAMLSQLALAGATLASNPAHLDQSIDTYA